MRSRRPTFRRQCLKGRGITAAAFEAKRWLSGPAARTQIVGFPPILVVSIYGFTA